MVTASARGRISRLKSRLKFQFLRKWYLHRKKLFWILCVAVGVIAVVLFIRGRSWLDDYLGGIEKTVISELAVGIGAAITGIIAIAFSLSLFAIQQVADRGTPATVQAYGRDRSLAAIYWALVALAVVSFLSAMLKVSPTYRTLTVAVCLLALLLSFVLLNIHFRRVVKFADPRYTVSLFYKRGEKQLKRLRSLRESLVPTDDGKAE